MGSKAEEKRLNEAIGAMKMIAAVGKFIDATRYGLYKQVKDSGFYKLSDKTWAQFCKEELGRDQKTVDGEIKLLEEFGENFLISMERIGLKKRDLYLLASMPEDARADIKNGEIQIGENTFLVDEIPEKADEFLRAFSLLGKEFELTKKELKQTTKKLDGIDGEQKKSEKTLLKKIEQLEAIMKPDTPEKLEEAFLTLDKMLEDFDNALRALVWKQPWVKDDPVAQAKVEGLQARAEKRFEGFRQDWDAFVTGEE